MEKFEKSKIRFEEKEETGQENEKLKQNLIKHIKEFDLEKAKDALSKKELIIDKDITEICQKKMEFILGPKGCGIDGIEDFISFCKKNSLEINLSTEKIIASCRNMLKYYLSPEPGCWQHFSWEEFSLGQFISFFQEYKILSKEQIAAVVRKKLENDLSKQEPLSSKEINKCRKIISIIQENNLEIDNSLLKKFQEKETEQKESPAEIIGFEKFDVFDISGKKIQGKEIMEKAAEILPAGLHCANIEKIEYEDRIDQMPDEYGIKGNSTALYNTSEKSITLFLIPNPDYKNQDYIKDFPGRIAHEFGHTIDPREIEQKDLSPSECKEMLKQWESVRRKEPPFSLYVEKISNENKWTEDSLKSKEDFAESVSFTLINPLYVKIFAPKRYKFCVSWLKKRFPKFDIKKIAAKNEEYFELLDNLIFD
jgi:hypothetical protein